MATKILTAVDVLDEDGLIVTDQEVIDLRVEAYDWSVVITSREVKALRFAINKLRKSSTKHYLAALQGIIDEAD